MAEFARSCEYAIGQVVANTVRGKLHVGHRGAYVNIRGIHLRNLNVDLPSVLLRGGEITFGAASRFIDFVEFVAKGICVDLIFLISNLVIRDFFS